jgi:hypothetical protein
MSSQQNGRFPDVQQTVKELSGARQFVLRTDLLPPVQGSIRRVSQWDFVGLNNLEALATVACEAKEECRERSPSPLDPSVLRYKRGFS